MVWFSNHLQRVAWMAGLSAHWLRGRRLYLDCDDYEAESNRYSSQWQKRVVARWENSLPRHVRGITVNTRFTQRRLEASGLSGDHIVYVPNGIDRERFARLDPERARALSAEIGLGEAPVVLYVGSLSSPSHPVDLLLEAFACILPARPDARLLIVGGGEDYQTIRQRVQEMGLAGRTIMTGRVDPDDVPNYYLLGDVVVDPVHDDAIACARSPLKLFEAMAAGVPVVTADVGDRREHLGGGQAGLIVRPGSSEALAEGLLTLLSDPGRRRAMGDRGRELAARYYWDVQVHQFARVYEL